jgi:hypothetical protein
MNERGLDAVARPYVAARRMRIHEPCTFELWFEEATAGKATPRPLSTTHGLPETT